MELFELKDFELKFSAQALGIECFKNIFNKDKSKTKDKALQELLFVFYYCDFRSDFIDIKDSEERTKEIKLNIGLPAEWKIDKVVNEAIIFYNKRENSTTEMQLLEAGLEAASKLGEHLKKIDLDERSEKSNQPVHDPKKIQSVIELLPKTVKSLIETKREIKKEKASSTDARGSISKGMFEDGFK